jgi:5-methylcytosine-specific restriction enzyme A
MLRKLLTHAVRTVRSHIKDLKTKRSSHWRSVEKTHLASHSDCVACGSKAKLNVHHKKPFHLDPSLELDPKNLITLCMAVGKHCHLLIGHGDDFKAYNPDVELDARFVHRHPELMSSIAAEVKKKRLYG